MAVHELISAETHFNYIITLENPDRIVFNVFFLGVSVVYEATSGTGLFETPLL